MSLGDGDCAPRNPATRTANFRPLNSQWQVAGGHQLAVVVACGSTPITQAVQERESLNAERQGTAPPSDSHSTSSETKLGIPVEIPAHFASGRGISHERRLHSLDHHSPGTTSRSYSRVGPSSHFVQGCKYMGIVVEARWEYDIACTLICATLLQQLKTLPCLPMLRPLVCEDLATGLAPSSCRPHIAGPASLSWAHEPGCRLPRRPCPCGCGSRSTVPHKPHPRPHSGPDHQFWSFRHLAFSGSGGTGLAQLP